MDVENVVGIAQLICYFQHPFKKYGDDEWHVVCIS
jgi:hypothetical protein